MYEDIVRRISACLTGKENIEEVKKMAIQLPMLVRVNGVYPTLVYLDEKNNVPSISQENTSKKNNSSKKKGKNKNLKYHIDFFQRFIVLSIKEKNLDIQKSNTKYELYHYLICVNKVLHLMGKKQWSSERKEYDLNELTNYLSSEQVYNNFLSSTNMKYRMDYGVEEIHLRDKYQKRLNISKIVKSEYSTYDIKQLKDLLRSKNEAIDHYNKLLGQPNLKREATVDTKLIIGMGEPSVREISMKLDHLTGIPYIPSSTIKGAFRSYLDFELEDEAVTAGAITRLFGNENDDEHINQDELTEKRGSLLFWDAYPSERYLDKLKIDLDGFTSMTQRLVPIDMLSIRKGAVFQFCISYSPLSAEDSLTNDWNIVEEYFVEFINTVALGSKKSVGYGLFKVKEEGKYDSK